MEPYLAKACRRAGLKLVAGFAVLGTIVGLRIVTVTPRGIESEIAELEQFDAERGSDSGGAGSASGADVASEADRDRSLDSDGAAMATRSGRREDLQTGSADLEDVDRLVRCRFGGQRQYMRAADCETRGGGVEELPPPAPDEDAAGR